jgi:hypothetical protein
MNITNKSQFPDVKWLDEADLEIIGYIDNRNIVKLGDDGSDTIVGLTTASEPSEESDYQALSLFEFMNHCPNVIINETSK